jgi:FAD dependent oxidoreductase TIGR03364
MQTSMRSGCELVSADQACIRAPELNRQALQAALYSSHELRVESRDAIPKLVNWLSSQWGVVFRFNESVHNIVAPVVTTSRATLQAERIVFCPGASLTGPFSERIAAYGLTRSKLQMMRLRPAKHFKLSGAIMSELSLVRYSGYAKLAGAELLRQRLLKEESDALAHGVHLIAVQSDDGSLVVGDSHHYHATPDPFFLSEIEKIVLRELQLTLAPQDYSVTERWIGEYPSSHSQDAIIDQPDSQTRMVIVSSGTGASTAFGLAMDVFEKW